MSAKAGIVNELHKAARRNYARRYVTIKGLDDLFQADIVEMRPYAKENKGYNYLITIINAFSKRGWAFPLKTKTGKEVAECLDGVFSGLKKPPKYLQTDHGKEFYNESVQRVLKKFGIKHYSSFSFLKASIVERFNRTLKNWMWREFSLRGSYEWLNLLDPLLKKYNSRVHRTIGLAPKAVNSKNEKTVLAKLMKKKLPPKKKNKLKVGDTVRISKFKHIFEKSYTPSWTVEIFAVKDVQKTVPVTYKLKDLNDQDIEGGFYEEELQKTNYKNTYLVEKVLKKKGNRALVKWLGFSDKHNQWVDLKDLD